MERFIIQKSERKGWWVCTDTDNLIVCRFEAHKFNDTQDFTVLEDSRFHPITAETATRIASLAAEMGDWLRVNHYDIIF